MPKVSLEESETEKERDLELDDNLKKNNTKKKQTDGNPDDGYLPNARS